MACALGVASLLAPATRLNGYELTPFGVVCVVILESSAPIARSKSGFE